MNGKTLKKYREKVGLSQQKLSEKTYIAQNTLSQYESGKRRMDRVTEEHVASHLRVTTLSESYQLTNELVRDITKQIVEDEVLDCWTNEVRLEPKNAGEDVLLRGGEIHIRCFTKNAVAVLGENEAVLTLENLHLGFSQWVARSTEYMKEQTVNNEEGDILSIDDIGVNEICQYALFNDLLCDLPNQ